MSNNSIHVSIPIARGIKRPRRETNDGDAGESAIDSTNGGQSLMISKNELKEIYQERQKLRLLGELAKHLIKCETAEDVVRVRRLPQFSSLVDDPLASFMRAATSETLHYKDNYLHSKNLLKEERDEHQRLKQYVETRNTINNADFLVPILPPQEVTEEMLESIEEIVIFDVQPAGVTTRPFSNQPLPSTMSHQEAQLHADEDEYQTSCDLCLHPCLELDPGAKLREVVKKLYAYRQQMNVEQGVVLRDLQVHGERCRGPNVTDKHMKQFFRDVLGEKELIQMADTLTGFLGSGGDSFSEGKRAEVKSLIAELKALHKEFGIIGHSLEQQKK